jgi:hypothetical protein
MQSWSGSGILSKALICIIGAIALTGCGVTAKRVVVGTEYQLNVEGSGNLGPRPAGTFEERCAVLAETIVQRHDELGGRDISGNDLTFVPFAESTITLPDGRTQVLTVLYQTRNGVRILDGIQYGCFDLKKGELRTVRAFLKDPSKLPAAPKPDMAVWTRMNEVFRAYLTQKGTPKTVFGIEEIPVITAEPARAGYLARYGRRNPDGSFSRFAAIIDPSNDRVNVLYDTTTE